MIKHQKWLLKNTESLKGKTVALTGSTGGLGKEICRYLGFLGADLILIDRNCQKAELLKAQLLEKFPKISIKLITADQEDINSVKSAVEQLKTEPLDAFIINAGAYSIPKRTCNTGYNNVFQINFVSPYYTVRELLPILRKRGGKVIAVGSIAHRYSKTDPLNLDFADKSRSSLIYGNAKRHLMFSLYELFKSEAETSLAVVHPGITFTGITAHYPKLIFAIIKHPMKVIFMKPRTAALSVIKGLFDSTAHGEWIGPAFFDVWGKPQKSRLKINKAEAERVFDTAEEIYKKL